MSDSKRRYRDLFGRHQAGISAFIRRRVQRSFDASDLTQEVYLRFLRADQVELIRNPEAYLYTVAQNLVREQSVLDRRWGHAVDPAELPAERGLGRFRTPEEEIDVESRLAKVLRLIETLPPKPQTALLLQYRDELTYEQIAQRMGVTPHAVKKYVMQGLALCRKRLLGLEGAAP